MRRRPLTAHVRLKHGTTLGAALVARYADALDRELPGARLTARVYAVPLRRARDTGRDRERAMEWPRDTPGYLTEEAGPVAPGQVARTEPIEGTAERGEVTVEEGETLREALARLLPRAVRQWSPPRRWGGARATVRLRLYPVDQNSNKMEGP